VTDDDDDDDVDYPQFSVIFTDGHVFVPNVFFINLLANCGSPLLSFDFLGLSRAIGS
jgi:hypothetical protein